MTKKIIAVVTTLTCIVFLVGPGVAQGGTAEDIAALQASIAALQTQLNAAVVQLAALQGAPAGAPTACSGVSFTRNLQQGASGSDVKCLQALLNQSASTQVAATGAGSLGNETTYFGSLTKAAVVKFQEKYASEVLTPVGLTSGTGFVGSYTRAKLNAMLVTVSPTPTPTPTPVPTGSPTPTPVLPVASGLTVVLDATNPAATTVIADTDDANDDDVSDDGAQALAPVMALKFSTPAGTSAKVTSLKITKAGVSLDTDVANMYLYDGATRLAEYTSVATHVFTFTNSAGLFTVSGEKVITVKMDVANNPSLSGKTLIFGVNSASDVVTDASAVNGTFPLTGNQMSGAGVSDLGELTLADVTYPGATTDPGLNKELWQFKLTSASQKIKVTYIKFTVIGTINVGDITNLYLTDGTTQYGSLVAGLASDKTLVFDLSASPMELSAGLLRNVSLKGDIVGGSSRNFYFSIRNANDMVAMDANYGVYIKVNQSDTFTAIVPDGPTEINEGSVQITKATDSPSGNVAQDALNVKLVKYTFKAIGEGLKITDLTVSTVSNATLGTDDVANAKILLDGAQIGTTKDLNTNGVTAADTQFSFGSQFVINAGQERTLEIYADIKKGIDDTQMTEGSTIQPNLKVDTDNVLRLTSGTSTGTPATTASSLTVTAADLSTTKNSSVNNVKTIASTQNVVIGSWLITAGSAEGVNVTQVKVVDDGTHGLGSAFDNLELWSGGVKYGQTITSPSSTDTAEQTFSLSPALKVTAGQSVQVDLIADVKGGAHWHDNEEVKLSSLTGLGLVTSQTVEDPTGAVGQQIIVVAAGKLLVSMSASPTNPNSTQIVCSDSTHLSEVVLGAWTFQEGSLAEDLKVTRIKVKEVGSDVAPGAIVSLRLFVNGVQVPSAAPITVPALTTSTPENAYAVFEYNDGLFTVPKASSVKVVLKGIVNDGINSFTGFDTANGLEVKFEMTNQNVSGYHTSTTDISAKGTLSAAYAIGIDSTGATLTADADYDAEIMKVVATKPTFAKHASSPSGILIGGNTEVLRFTITAEPQGDVVFVSGQTNLRFTVIAGVDHGDEAYNLYDAATDTTVADPVTADVDPDTQIDFTTFAATIDGGTTKTFYVKTNLHEFTAGETFQLGIKNAAGDMSFDDGSGGVTQQLPAVNDAFVGKGLPLDGGVLTKPAT